MGDAKGLVWADKREAEAGAGERERRARVVVESVLAECVNDGAAVGDGGLGRQRDARKGVL